MHVNLDPVLVDKIVGEVKSQGVFDQFRRDSMSDVDTKPAYQNLRQRVEASVFKFLSDLKWRPETNKNQLREKLRKHITDAGFLDTGVERIVDQVVNPKISTVFQPKIEDIAYKYLGIEKPQNKFEEKFDASSNSALSIKTDLLPNDLEAVSPESESKSDSKEDLIEPFNDAEEKNDDFESPPFEPLEGRPPTPIQDEKSNQSHLSGISGLTSQDSISSERELNFKKEHSSMHESVLSQVSSSSRLSMHINNEENTIKTEIEAKPTADMSEEAQMPNFSNTNDSKTKSALHFDINKQEFKFEGTKSKFINSFYGKSKKSDLDSSQYSDKKNDKSSNEVSNTSTSCESDGGSRELSTNSGLGIYESVSKEPNSFTCETLKPKEPTTSNNTYDDGEKLNSFNLWEKSTITCKMEKTTHKIDSRKSRDERSKQKRTYYKETVGRENVEKSKEKAHGDNLKFSSDEKNDTKAKRFEIDDHSSYRIKGMKRRSTESDDEGEKNTQKTNLSVKLETSDKTTEPTYVKNTTTTNAGKQKPVSNAKTHSAKEIVNLQKHKNSFDTNSSEQEEEDTGFRFFEIDALEEQNENKKIECLSKLIEELASQNSAILPGFQTIDSQHSSKITDIKKSKSALITIAATPALHNMSQNESYEGTNKRKRDGLEREAFIDEKRRKEPQDYFSTTLSLSAENIAKRAKNFMPSDFASGDIIENYVDHKEFNNAVGRSSTENLTIPFQPKTNFKGQSFREDELINSKSVEIALKPPAEKKSLIAVKGTQRYSNEDLYKPRSALTNRPRRRFLDNE